MTYWQPHEISAGIRDRDLGPRITSRRLGPPGLLPEEDHEPRPCAHCGLRGVYPTIVRTVLRDWPNRVSFVCADSVLCLRARRQAA